MFSAGKDVGGISFYASSSMVPEIDGRPDRQVDLHMMCLYPIGFHVWYIFPTFGLDFYGKGREKYQSHGSYGYIIYLQN